MMLLYNVIIEISRAFPYFILRWKCKLLQLFKYYHIYTRKFVTFLIRKKCIWPRYLNIYMELDIISNNNEKFVR